MSWKSPSHRPAIFSALSAFPFLLALVHPACRGRTNNETDDQAKERAPVSTTKDTTGGSESTARPLSSLPRWSIGARVLEAKSEAFKSHAGGTAYLAMALPLEPVSPIVPKIESAFGVKLKTRGEAHITILTPPEAGELAKAGLGMKDIEKAFASEVQAIPYEVLCVGEAVSTKDAKLKTYFLVVRSPGLFDLRARVLERAKERAGGKSVRFSPEAYYPHVTVGFTQRDLHIDGDGVRKDARTCKYALEVEGGPAATTTPTPTATAMPTEIPTLP